VKDLVEEALELQTLLIAQGWPFCFIGGLAVQRWSEPRLTKDVDLTLLAGFGSEEKYVDLLLRHYVPRRKDARTFALIHRVLLLKTTDGIGIDVALGALPFEESAVRRACMEDYAPGIALCTCTAEDLLVMKAFASRPRDWEDIRGILVRQGTKSLDWHYIFSQLRPLCDLKEELEIVDRVEQLRVQISDKER